MGKPLKVLARHLLYRGKPNLQSLDDPYPTIAKLLRNIDIKHIVDAGASDGRIAKRFGKRFTTAQLHMFEPNPDYAPALAELHAVQPRYHHYPVVLSDTPGEKTFYVTADPGSSSLYQTNDAMKKAYPEQAAHKAQMTVPATTLDQWADENNIAGVQFIKMDIQGGEADMMRGASRLLDESVVAIYTEVFFQNFYEGGATYSDIDLVLREHGFGLYSLYKPRHDENERVLFADAVFVNPKRLGW
ncbi:MAG: FkbM family methyltransferase [Planctomycetota bacterium]